MNHKADALSQVKDWFATVNNDYIVYDLETTGLDPAKISIVSIAIVDHNGNTLLDTLVKPPSPIPADASRIHGVTDDHVKDAPSFADIADLVWRLMHAKRWVGYNIINYDNVLLHEEYRRLGWFPPKARRQDDELSTDMKHYRADHFDMMYVYSEWVGERGRYDDYKWQKLIRAREEFGIETGDAHNALTDALATWHLLNKFREMELPHD